MKLARFDRRPRRCRAKCDLLAFPAPLGGFRHFRGYLKSEGTKDAGQLPSVKVTLNGFLERGTGSGWLNIPLLGFNITARQVLQMNSRQGGTSGGRAHPKVEVVGGGCCRATRSKTNYAPKLIGTHSGLYSTHPAMASRNYLEYNWVYSPFVVLESQRRQTGLSASASTNSFPSNLN